MPRRNWIAVATLLFVAAAAGSVQGQPQAQTQTPPPMQSGINEMVVVTARESKLIADAVNALRASRDPLVATTIADNILTLTDAMAVSGRTYQIGPLTRQEQTVIDLDAFLKKREVAGGPIRLQPRRPDSTEGPRAYTLTRSSFISLCADMASTGLIQIRVIQETKMIVVGRIIQDLNEQQQELIPEREILKGMLRGFENQDRRGVIIDRVLDIADAIAASGMAYDLVPDDQQKAFRDLGHMDRGVFEVVPQARPGMANIRYGGQIHTTSVDHFVWFFVRFLLADEARDDSNIRAQRIALGGKLLDHLTVQLQINALAAVVAAVDAAGAAGPAGIPLGNFRARGPGLDVVKHAPGLSQQPSPRGPDDCVLVVSAKQARKLPELRAWLGKQTKNLCKRVQRDARCTAYSHDYD